VLNWRIGTARRWNEVNEGDERGAFAMQNRSMDVHLTGAHVRDVQPSALGCEDCLKNGGH
jgi:hypothetical protein